MSRVIASIVLLPGASSLCVAEINKSVTNAEQYSQVDHENTSWLSLTKPTLVK